MERIKCLRPYQQDIVTKLETIYSNHLDDKRSFLVMPTGTGKTFTALKFAIAQQKCSEPRTVVWTSHQTSLSIQSGQSFIKDFKELGGRVLQYADKAKTVVKRGKLDNITFIFMTWQSFRKQVAVINADMLVIDEAHYGSSMNGSSKQLHKSFKKIIIDSKIPSQLYVSATPWKLNPELYPNLLSAKNRPLASRQAFLSVRTARELGLVAGLELRSFMSADTLKLKAINSGMEDAIEDEEMEGLVEKIKNKKVNVKDASSLKVLRAATTDTALEMLMRHEGDDGKKDLPQTIIFCPSISNPEDPRCVVNVVNRIKMLARKVYGNSFNTGSAFVQGIHSRSKVDNEQVIAKFRQEEVKILVVKGMLQEGFDHPPLKVALDLTLKSTMSQKRFIQKLGRVIRLHNNETGRYYYVDCVEQHVVINGTKKILTAEAIENIKDDILNSHPEIDESTAEDLAKCVGDQKILAASLERQETECDQMMDEPGHTATVILNDDNKKVYLTTVQYVVLDAQNKNKREMRTDFFANLTSKFRDTASDKKTLLLTMAKNGYKKPTKKSATIDLERLATVFYNYISPFHSSYDPEFVTNLRKLQPSWLISPRMSSDKKSQLFLMAKNGLSRPRKTSNNHKEKTLGAALSSYLSKSNSAFDKEFYLKIKNMRPDWIYDKHKNENVIK